MHSLAIGSDGNTYSWGKDWYGDLGIGAVNGASAPTRVHTPTGVHFTQVSAGLYHSLAIGDDGHAYAWGAGPYLGYGSQTNQSVPVRVNQTLLDSTPGARYTSISAANNSSLAIGSDGHAYAWGDNTWGELGIGLGDYGIKLTPARVNQTLLDSTPGARYISISAGRIHSLALGSDGHAYAWGDNSWGQLGDGSVSGNQNTPVRVDQTLLNTTPGARYTSISAGNGFSLATGSDGHAYAWGQSGNGRLGDGTFADQHTPVRVDQTMLNSTPGATYTSVAAGTNHSLAIGSDGHIYAWGDNSYGSVGDGTNGNLRLAPVRTDQTALGNTNRYTSISAGEGFSLAIGSNGYAYSWGLNGVSNLGNTNYIERDSPGPVAVPRYVIDTVKFDTTAVTQKTVNTSTGTWDMHVPQHPAGAVTVTVGYHLDALDDNGNILLPNYGSDTVTLHYTYKAFYKVDFSLGDAIGNTSSPTPASQIVYSDDPQPIKFPNPTPVWEHHWFTGWTTNGTDYWDFTKPVTSSMTLTAKWEAWSFTIDPAVGPTTGGNTVNITPPKPPQGIVYQQVSAGGYLSLAIGSDGNTYAWGNNQYGQLGDNTTTSRKLPVRVHTPTGVHFTAISAGCYHALALGDDGNIYAWGYNQYGQLGDGTTTNKKEPVATHHGALPAGQRFTAISAGFYHSLALGSDNKMYSWGLNNMGQLGDGTTSSGAHQADGTPIHATADKIEPVLVHNGALPASEHFTSISAGRWHSLALGSDHKIYSWGYNGSGQLGNGIQGGGDAINNFPTGSTADQSEPVLVHNGALPASEHFTTISAGSYHSLALGSDGQTYSWGTSNMGQLGDGTNFNRPEPVQVHHGALPVSEHFVTISAGAAHNIAIGSDGRTYSWGWNLYDQLGDGTGVDRKEPVLTHSGALQATGRFTTICAGPWHNLAFGTDHHTYSWGWNDSGLLGDGTILDKNEPVLVGLQEILVTGIKFDQTEATPAPVWDPTLKKWKVTAPAHNPGRITTNIHWTLDGVAQPDYPLPYDYQWNLPAAGTIPLQRYSGATFIALTAITAVSLTGHQLSRARKRNQGKHSLRPNHVQAQN
ncbi:hypothetical protein KIM372_01880 [Bombiscardovia nodaiensis]|uniref:RCC1-like domain-containing protein n=1 Tax=Bombiscardovia nodaiensis TaxID=2932181 RepID=A0ABN6SBU0_9BIFI|nr:hypothetical protein KIM372_01880 [Bombiscardovia nodaiensis]